MGNKDVWVPEIILTNPSQKLDSFGKVWQLIHYDSNGGAAWFPEDLIKATCFPFDIQGCSMELHFWAYAAYEVRLIPTRDYVELGFL